MQKSGSRVTPSEIMEYNGFYFEREIRDPIYGYIYVTKIENDIIDTDEFQRLDRIYQTPSAHYVYPDATHTRKAHSLGVMHLAHRSLFNILYRQCPEIKERIHPLLSEPSIFKETYEITKLDQEDYNAWWNSKSYIELLQIIRIAGLLHDIGHGPFSHIFESVCKSLHEKDKCDEFTHEDMSIRIIQERLSDKISNPLSCDDIIMLLSKSDKPPEELIFLKSLIDGPYDIDKLDYLSRDSYHSGAHEYGGIDYERIIKGFRVKDGRLLISRSSLGCVMDCFTAAQYMYTNVYYHKTSRIFDFMIFDALAMVPSFLQNLIEDLDYFLLVDDHNIILELKNKQHLNDVDNDYTGSYNLLKDVLNRKKRYKTIYEKMLTLSVVSEQEKQLTGLRESLETEFDDLHAKVDVTTQVKPIRVNPIELELWLRNPVILDTDGSTKPLKEISWAYFSSLTKLQVLFRVLIDTSIIDDPRETELKEEAKKRINVIEERESMARA